MESTNDKLSKKIITTIDAHNYLINNIELKSLKKTDCFFAMYLNENAEVLYIKTIEKRITDSDIEIVSQILDFDETLNVNSLIVFHKPLKSKGIDAETAIANLLIDKAFFAVVNLLDYQWIFSPEHSHSMFKYKNVNFGKHSLAKTQRIKKMSNIHPVQTFKSCLIWILTS